MLPRRTWFPPAYQVIGKDILRFHCVYWPAFLMAADLPLPSRFIAHAHWTVEVRGTDLTCPLGPWLKRDIPATPPPHVLFHFRFPPRHRAKR